jgi:hypothetical protein
MFLLCRRYDTDDNIARDSGERLGCLLDVEHVLKCCVIEDNIGTAGQRHW